MKPLQISYSPEFDLAKNKLQVYEITCKTFSLLSNFIGKENESLSFVNIFFCPSVQECSHGPKTLLRRIRRGEVVYCGPLYCAVLSLALTQQARLSSSLLYDQVSAMGIRQPRLGY